MNRFMKSIPITPDMVSLWVPSGLNRAQDLIRGNHGQCHGTHPNVPVIAPPIDQISDCDATTDWTGTSLSIDTDDKKEGTGSLKDTVASPAVATWYQTQYNPAGTWDWSAKKHLLFWLKSDRASTAFTSARVYIIDSLDNNRYWDLTFSAGEWTVVKCLLSTGDGESATPPNLALINFIRVMFYSADTTPFYKKIDYLRVTGKPSLINPSVGWSFDGVDDYVEILDDNSLNFGTNDFTIALWMKIPLSGSGPYNNGIITKGYTTSAPAHTWGIVQHSTYLDRIVYSDAIDAGGTWNANLYSDALSDGWHHICVKREGNKYYFYVDGNEISADTKVAVDLTNASNLVMGALYSHVYCIGTNIALPFIAKSAWSVAQINNFYRQTKGLFAPRG